MSDEQPRRVRMVAPLVRKPAELELPVRNPAPEDIPELADLLLDAYVGTIDFDGSETLADAVDVMQSYFDGAVGEPLLGCSYVAEQRGHLVSASLVTIWEELPLLAFSFTGAEEKGRGYASALIQLSMNCLAAYGYERIALVVTRGNDPAERVYARLGFVAE